MRNPVAPKGPALPVTFQYKGYSLERRWDYARNVPGWSGTVQVPGTPMTLLVCLPSDYVERTAEAVTRRRLHAQCQRLCQAVRRVTQRTAWQRAGVVFAMLNKEQDGISAAYTADIGASLRIMKPRRVHVYVYVRQQSWRTREFQAAARLVVGLMDDLVAYGL